jgi:hypothetical protein
MARSNAATVEDYLEELPEDRRAVVAAVRAVVLENLPEGYEETMNWGMIAYEVPLARYPDTYNGQPLGYVALAAQKRYYALYLWGVYADPAQAAYLEAAFDRAGKKMDLGKSCLRFRRLEDLPLAALGEIIASTPPETLTAQYEARRERA